MFVQTILIATNVVDRPLKYTQTRTPRDCIFLVHEIHLCLKSKKTACMCWTTMMIINLNISFTFLYAIVFLSMLSPFLRRFPIHQLDSLKSRVLCLHKNDGECINKTEREHKRSNNNQEEAYSISRRRHCRMNGKQQRGMTFQSVICNDIFYTQSLHC